jgi:hypothetical protein
MYAEINETEIRRCPIPPFPASYEDDAEDAGIVPRNQPEIGHQHRNGRAPTVIATPERV